MKNIKEAIFIRDICETTSNMYRLGWDERNGGNISYLLNDADKLYEYLDINDTIRKIPIGFAAISLANKCFVVTGTGKYFKNIETDPENDLGIIRISFDGTNAELLWGFRDGGKFTSELPAHLMSHIERLAVNPLNRVIIHTHPTYTIAMNTICTIDEKQFTHKLWQINTECIVVFPDGIGMLPWMVCGTNEIGQATADKMREYRLIVWSNHGIYGAGASLDEAFGLIETVEKAAQIYMLTEGHKRINLISDEQLQSIANAFGVTPKSGILTNK